MIKKLESKLAYQNPYMQVFEDTVALSDNSQATWTRSVFGDGVSIFAIDKKSEVVMIKQYRHGVSKRIWSLPAGGIKNGDSALNTAKYELEEETGVVAHKWTPLGYFYPSPGYVTYQAEMFLAQDLDQGIQNLEIGENDIEIYKIPVKQVWQMVVKNEIEDAWTIIPIIKAIKKLGLKLIDLE